jgi:poly(3-hydroxybutyrate) depolymerase
VFLVQAISASVTGDTVEPPGGAPGCFQAGRQGLADSPDGPYFDQIVAEVAATYCVDLDQIYVTGWSSGAWLSNYLACARGNVIRGTASGSGGLQADHGPCTGGAAVMIFPGDAGSTQEDGVDIGAAVARDLFITTNGCSTTPTTMSFGAAGNCDYYGDCAAPVVYCHDGGGHGGPLGFLQDSSWEFWNSFP